MSTPAATTLKSVRRDYSPGFRAEALVLLKANKNNLLQTAKQLEMPYHTLREWAKNGRGITPEVVSLQHIKTGTLDQKFELIANLYSDRLTEPDVVAKASPLDAAKIAGIATDKRQLLNGMPTSISGSVMSEDERRLRVAELLGRIQSRTAADVKPLQESPV